MAKPFNYGGQAVLEGVMMRGLKHYAIAVRQKNNEITTITKRLSNICSGPFRRIPLIRGILVLVETIVIGIQSLLYSADMFMEEEQVQGKSAMLWVALLIGLALGIGLFLAIPLVITWWAIDPHISSPFISNLVDGSIRLAIVITYIWAIGFIPDVRRVFGYHGAEHKTINAYENGAALEVAEVKKYSTAHARCGTGFLLIVLAIALVAYIFMGRPPIYLRFLQRLALMPAIAAVSYELMRLGARHYKNRIVRIIMAPGLALQSLTTRQPDDQQIEVSITSLKTVLDAEATTRELSPEQAPLSTDV